MTTTYSARCADTKLCSSSPAEKVRAERVQINADKLAAMLGYNINISNQNVGTSMLSYGITHAKYGGIDKLRNKVAKTKFVYLGELDGMLNSLRHYSDHPRSLFARGTDGKSVLVGHVSSPYAGTNVESVRRTMQHAVDVLGQYFDHIYGVIVLGNDDNLYYPADERLKDCMSIVIIDKTKLEML